MFSAQAFIHTLTSEFDQKVRRQSPMILDSDKLSYGHILIALEWNIS